jgi:hypothetical protein
MEHQKLWIRWRRITPQRPNPLKRILRKTLLETFLLPSGPNFKITRHLRDGARAGAGLTPELAPELASRRSSRRSWSHAGARAGAGLAPPPTGHRLKQRGGGPSRRGGRALQERRPGLLGEEARAEEACLQEMRPERAGLSSPPATPLATSSRPRSSPPPGTSMRCPGTATLLC